MNENVRNYLIAAAREKDKFVYYSDVVKDCSLNININTQAGRDQLSHILGEISAFEDQQIPSRPLISSLAMYKDRSKNDHGDGFYKLASQLGKGSVKQLRDELYAFTEAERSREYWQQDIHYEEFGHISSSRSKSISDLFLKVMNDKKYDWIDDWHTAYMEFTSIIEILRENILRDSMKSIEDESLYVNLPEPFDNFDKFMRRWLKDQNNGISSRGQSVLSEADYNRILNDDTFRVFASGILIKPNLELYTTFTNWWYNNPSIKNRPLLINRAFSACNWAELSSTVDNYKFWKVIDILKSSYGFKLSEESNYNWYSANQRLTEWLDIELKEVISLETEDVTEQKIWRNIFVWLIFSEFNSNNLIPNTLQKRDPPSGEFEDFPERERTFKGVDVDYEQKAKRHKDLGDAGEELVKQHEINCLLRIGMSDKASQVKIIKDGEGYDVLSFDENGAEKFIEVKTTTGDALSSFYLSRNEIAFLRMNADKYFIYRVYNYDEENNSGEYFELKPNVESQLLMQPTQYEVLLKKTQ